MCQFCDTRVGVRFKISDLRIVHVTGDPIAPAPGPLKRRKTVAMVCLRVISSAWNTRRMSRFDPHARFHAFARAAKLSSR